MSSTPKQIKVEACRIFLPKAGWVRMVMHREIIGAIRNVTVSRHGMYWHAAIQVERERDEPMLKIGAAEGADLGVVNALTLSDGIIYDLPRVSDKEQRRTAALQKAVARKAKGSKNRIRAKLRLQRHQAKIVRRRKDAKRKMTTKVSRRVAVLCLQELKVRNMTASAKGTVEAPGTNVAQKAGLNRVVLDVSPGETRIQFEYKMKREGGRIVYVNPAYTSQQCSCCLHRERGSRPDRDTFRCLSCGHEDCAGLNAAKNIRRKGLEALTAQIGGHPGMACGSNSAGSRKQERDGREAGSSVLQGGE